jgi:hypothetical protein
LWLIANPNNSQFWANCRSPLLFAYYSPFAIRRSLPFSVVAAFFVVADSHSNMVAI